MLAWLINFTKGILSITIKGVYLDRLLNICLKNNISLWDISRINDYEITSKIHIGSFKKLCKLGSNTKCKVHITSKKGVPFIVKRFSVRPCLFAGIFLFLISLYFTNSFIWSINISGNETISNAEILENLNTLNVHIGSKSSKIDEYNIKNDMLLNIPNLSFIAINVYGNQLSVQIKERTIAPPIFNPNEAINIISDKNGLIEEINVKSGIAVKHPGETILAGEMIVSSIIPFETDGARYEHALADIKARTWNEQTRVLPTNLQKKDYTGKKHTKYYISAFDNRFNLYFSKKVPFKNYDKIHKYYKLNLNPSFTFPVYIASEEYIEYNLIDTPLDLNDAKTLMVEYAKRDLQKSINGDIINFDYKIYEKDNLIYLYYTAECLENIGIEEIDTRNINDFIKKEEE